MGNSFRNEPPCGFTAGLWPVPGVWRNPCVAEDRVDGEAFGSSSSRVNELASFSEAWSSRAPLSLSRT